MFGDYCHKLYLCGMKGLDEYVAKHGMHYTKELTHDVLGDAIRWSRKDLKKVLHKKVWYNVTGATDEDIYFMANYFRHASKSGSLKIALNFIGNFKLYGLLCVFINDYEDFDFTPYI